MESALVVTVAPTSLERLGRLLLWAKAVTLANATPQMASSWSFLIIGFLMEWWGLG